MAMPFSQVYDVLTCVADLDLSYHFAVIPDLNPALFQSEHTVIIADMHRFEADGAFLF